MNNKYLLTFLLLAIASLSYVIVKEDYINRVKTKYNIFQPQIPEIKDKVKLNQIQIYNDIKEIKKPEIIFFGDSNIERFRWNDFFSKTIFNRGISGSGSFYLSSINNKLDVNLNTVIVISLGINDIYYGIKNDKISQNIFDFIKNTYPDNRLILNSILYVSDKRKEHKKINKLVSELNQIIKTEASKYPNIIFLDLNQKLSKFNLLDNLYTYDGVHLNPLGYKIWLQELKKYL